ncbi:MAG: cobalamin-independent methionine synthase II family protein [Chloroflexi bacterium]|nr:cobalamin-independent methionine synthase II family protein [Chloroflexota bacterium]
MKRSTERILTTHTGSLPRPDDLLAMIQVREAGEAVDAAQFAARVRSAVTEIVRQQVAAGIDIVSDGELGKPSFASYVSRRIQGFGGENPEPRPFLDATTFPGWGETIAVIPRGLPMKRQFCVGDLAYADADAVQADVDNLARAVSANGALEGFMPAASLGIIADIMVNQHYPSETAYLYALADAMKTEYEAIARAGLVVQIDAPDAAMGRHGQFRHESLETFRRATAERVEALNHALAGIPEEQIRYHICWGNYEGPHVHDVPLADVADLLLAVRAGAYSVEAANPRHAHEWQAWEQVTLPEDKVLIPGVIDSTTNFVEHPEVVAQRIEQYARIVGRERVIAGTDCGFGTTAGRATVHPEIVWAKLAALAEGAALASARLWR